MFLREQHPKPPSSQTPNTSFGLAQNYRDVTGPCHLGGRREQNRNVNKVHHTLIKSIFASNFFNCGFTGSEGNKHVCAGGGSNEPKKQADPGDITLHKLGDCNVKHVFVHRWDQTSSFGVQPKLQARDSTLSSRAKLGPE